MALTDILVGLQKDREEARETPEPKISGAKVEVFVDQIVKAVFPDPDIAQPGPTLRPWLRETLRELVRQSGKGN